MMLRYFAILAVVMASFAWAEEAPTGMDTVSSGDKLHLSYVPHVQSRLFGMPGSTARIQVKLKNKGFEGGIFKIEVISSNADFRGDYPPVVEVGGRSESTIDIAQLIVPDVAEGTVIKMTVRATRRSEMNKSPAYGADIVEVILRFTVGKEPGDEEKPKVSSEYGSGCTVSANNTEECDQQKWHMKFNVKDTGSGLSSVSVRRPIATESLKYPMDYSHNNFEIGTKDNVRVSTEVSCCITSVSLRAVDLTGEEYNSDFMEGAGAGSISSMAFGTLTLIALAISRLDFGA